MKSIELSEEDHKGLTEFVESVVVFGSDNWTSKKVDFLAILNNAKPVEQPYTAFEGDDKVTFATYKMNGDDITKDGHIMFKSDVVKDLNRKSYLESLHVIDQNELATIRKELLKSLEPAEQKWSEAEITEAFKTLRWNTSVIQTLINDLKTPKPEMRDRNEDELIKWWGEQETPSKMYFFKVRPSGAFESVDGITLATHYTNGRTPFYPIPQIEVK